MTTYLSGAIVRTTHLTGTATDIGIEAAQILLRRSQSFWKLSVLCCFVIGFFTGGCLGTVYSVTHPRVVLFIPSVVFFSLAALNDAFYSTCLKADENEDRSASKSEEDEIISYVP